MVPGWVLDLLHIILVALVPTTHVGSWCWACSNAAFKSNVRKVCMVSMRGEVHMHCTLRHTFSAVNFIKVHWTLALELLLVCYFCILLVYHCTLHVYGTLIIKCAYWACPPPPPPLRPHTTYTLMHGAFCCTVDIHILMHELLNWPRQWHWWGQWIRCIASSNCLKNPSLSNRLAV